MHQRKRWLVGLLLALGSASAVQAAGTMDNPPKDVAIVPDVDSRNLRIASGAVHTARFGGSGMDAEQIGCEVTTYGDVDAQPKGRSSVICLASFRTADGSDPVQLGCYSEDPDIIAAALSINLNSFIEFETMPDSSGDSSCNGPSNPCNDCYYLKVSNSSTHWQVPLDH